MSFFTPIQVATDASQSNQGGSLRKVFRAAGRIFVFYINQTPNIGWRSSADNGSTWSAFTAITEAGAWSWPDRIGFLWDGTYVHYARAVDTILIYRRGTPNSDGTITWTAEVTVAGAPPFYDYPVLNIDTNGAVYIFCNDSTNTNTVLFKNANSDGTWSTVSGFPVTVIAGVQYTWKALVPLYNGYMYMLYSAASAATTAPLLGNLWTGTVQAQETIGTGITGVVQIQNYWQTQPLSAVGDSVRNIVHVAWIAPFNLPLVNVYHARRPGTIGGTWSVRTVFAGDTTTSSPTLTLCTFDGRLECVFTNLGSYLEQYEFRGNKWTNIQEELIAPVNVSVCLSSPDQNAPSSLTTYVDVSITEDSNPFASPANIFYYQIKFTNALTAAQSDLGDDFG